MSVSAQTTVTNDHPFQPVSNMTTAYQNSLILDTIRSKYITTFHKDRIIECDGFLIYVRPDRVGSEIRQLLQAGYYEITEGELLWKYLPEDVDVIELGAGLGYISSLIDERLHHDRTHVALEPNPEITPWLRRTKLLNKSEFDVENMAYSATSDTVQLSVRDEFWTGDTVDDKGTTVASDNLKNICDKYGVSLFSLVMDIESTEYDLLVSEMEFLEERCPFLLVEFHEMDPDRSSYHGELRNSDFDLIERSDSVYAYRNTSPHFEEDYRK
ncbi:FkbM family methyltransferase [Natrialbaceae archaeon A-arb3/5]